MWMSPGMFCILLNSLKIWLLSSFSKSSLVNFGIMAFTSTGSPQSVDSMGSFKILSKNILKKTLNFEILGVLLHLFVSALAACAWHTGTIVPTYRSKWILFQNRIYSLEFFLANTQVCGEKARDAQHWAEEVRRIAWLARCRPLRIWL